MSRTKRVEVNPHSWLAAGSNRRRLRSLIATAVSVGLAATALRWGAAQRKLSAEEWEARPVTELEALASSQPRNPGPPIGLGTQYARAGDLPRATAAFERCLALAPDCFEACARLADIARRQGDDRRAAEFYSRAVSVDPSFDEGYLEAADALIRMQSYRRARPLADAYTQRCRDDWRGPFLQGQISAGEGRMPEALAHYSEAIRRAPAHSPTYLNAGVTFLYGPATPDRLAAAAGWFQRGLALAPEYPELHYYLGLVRFRQHRWAEATAVLRRAVELNPALTEAYFPLAQSLRKLGRSSEADLCLDLYRSRRERERHG